MRRPLAAALLVMGLGLGPGFPGFGGEARACALELVLAVDVSGSIDRFEFELQIDGLAAAFESEALADAITRLDGPVLAAVTHWSGTSRQRLVVGWHELTDAASMTRFADAIRRAPRAFENYSTAVGEALGHAARISAGAPADCARRVIDISGDGVSNEGRPPRRIADGLAAIGYTVNALVIRGADPDPYPFFRDQVIAGPGAFVEIAESYDDYPSAILRKLLREVEAPVAVGLAE